MPNPMIKRLLPASLVVLSLVSMGAGCYDDEPDTYVNNTTVEDNTPDVIYTDDEPDVVSNTNNTTTVENTNTNENNNANANTNSMPY